MQNATEAKRMKMASDDSDAKLLRLTAKPREGVSNTTPGVSRDVLPVLVKGFNAAVKGIRQQNSELAPQFIDGLLQTGITTAMQSGQLTALINEGVINGVRSEMEIQSKMRPVKINVSLSKFQLDNLTKCFPSFRFDSDVVRDTKNHSVARFTRKVCEMYIEYCLLRVDESCTSSQDRFLLKDVGASLVKGIKRGDLRRHFCCPDPALTGYQDARRRAEADEFASRRSENMPNNVKILIDSYMSKQSKFFCNRFSQFCCEKAMYQKFLFTHDMTAEEMCKSMLISESQMGAGCLMFSPMIILSRKGYLKHSECYWERFVFDGVERIRFRFTKDSQCEYVHNYNEYINFFTKNYVEVEIGSIRKGYIFSFEVSSVDVAFFTIMPCNYTIKNSYILRSLPLNMHSDYVVVIGFWYNLAKNNSMSLVPRNSDSIEPFTLTVRTGLYNAICQYAYSRGTDFTVQKVMQAAMVLNGRCNSSGTSFIFSDDNDGERLTETELAKLSVAIYLQVYRKKHEMLKTTSLGVDDQQRVKSVKDGGIFRRLVESSNDPSMEEEMEKIHVPKELQENFDIISKAENREHGYIFLKSIRQWFRGVCNKIFACKQINFSVDNVILDEHAVVSIQEFISTDPDKLETKIRSANYKDKEILIGVVKAVMREQSEVLPIPLIDHDDFKEHHCQANLEIMEIPKDGTDCLYLALMRSGVREESVSKMRQRLAESNYLKRVSNYSGLRERLLSGECGESALLPVVSFEYGVSVCLHVNGECRLYGGGGPMVHIKYSNNHFDSLVSPSNLLVENLVEATGDVLEPVQPDKALEKFERRLAPYNFLEVAIDDKRKLIDTYVFLSSFQDTTSDGYRVFDPLGVCKHLFESLPLFIPVTFFSGLDKNGDPAYKDAILVYGERGLGRVSEDPVLVAQSVLGGLLCDVVVLGLDQHTSALDYPEPRAVLKVDELPGVLTVALCSLKHNASALIRVAFNEGDRVRPIASIFKYFESRTFCDSSIAPASCRNLYIVLKYFDRTMFMKDFKSKKLSFDDQDLSNYTEIMRYFSVINAKTKERVADLKEKFLLVGGCERKLTNLLRLEKLRRSNEYSSLFSRSNRVIGAGNTYYVVQRRSPLDGKFVVCDRCFSGVDSLLTTRIASSRLSAELALDVTPGTCACNPGESERVVSDGTSVDEVESLMVASRFSEFEQDVQKVYVDITIEESQSQSAQTIPKEVDEVKASDVDSVMKERLSEAASEAKKLLVAEVNTLTNQCRELWTIISRMSEQDKKNYIEASNTQVLLLNNNRKIASPNAINNIADYNYVYMVEPGTLVPVQAYANGLNGYAIVTEKCCPFLAIDILNHLNSLGPLNLSHLKEAHFIQAIPGAGKTYTMINEHVPKESLLVTQTKAGRKDLITRVSRRLGKVDQRDYVTTASVLVNGVQRRYKYVYFDEAAQQHAGFAAWVASISGCEYLICIGDRKQIPFIPRVDNFVCEHKDIFSIIPTIKNLTKTYRVPENQLRLLSPFYVGCVPSTIESANNYRGEVRMRPYNEMDVIAAVKINKFDPPLQSKVVLTFTQGEKAELTTLLGDVRNTDFKGVYTLHEFQGQEADHVYIVRKTNNNKAVALYNDEHQIVVAVSRNKKTLTYFTTCMEDGLGERITEFNRLIGGGNYIEVKPCFRVKPGALKDVPSGLIKLNIANYCSYYATANIPFVNFSDIEEKVSLMLKGIPKGTTIYINDYLYERFEGDFLNSALPKLFDGFNVVMMSNRQYCRDTIQNLEDFSIQRFEEVDHNTIVEEELDGFNILDTDKDVCRTIVDPASLQFIYNTMFPLSSYRDYWFDRYEVNSMVISPHFSDLTVSFNPTDYVNDIQPSTYLTPVLETHMGNKRLNTVQEQLLGLYKRNANVSPTTVSIDYFSQVDRLMDSFESSLKITDYKVSVSRNDVMEWLNDKGRAQVIAIENELSEVIDFRRWVMMIKTDVKPTLTDDIFTQYPAVQTILYSCKTYNALFAPFLNKLRKRILSLLKDHVFVLSDGNIADYERRLNDNYFRMTGDVLEMDMGKFDKSQGLSSLLFECEMFVRSGMPTWMVNLWFLSHLLIKVKGFGTSIRLQLPHQRRSGDPWTFGGNTFYLLAILLNLCGPRVRYIMVSGDDSLVFGDFPLAFRKQLCDVIARDYLFDVKLVLFKSKYFCSRFMINTNKGIRLVPDPVKLLIKLGRKDLRDYKHAEEYRISLMDLVASFGEDDVCLTIDYVARDRYPKCPSFYMLMKMIFNIVMSHENFMDLYKCTENPVVDVVIIPYAARKTLQKFSIVGSLNDLVQGENVVAKLGCTDDENSFSNKAAFIEYVTNLYQLRQDTDSFEKFISAVNLAPDSELRKVICGVD